MNSSKPILGICGGIGAGKTRVALEFEVQGCLVSDSDRLNHEVLETRAVQATLKGWWGDEVVAADGRTNRRRIGEIVFEDDIARQRLESLVYPLIDKRRRAIIRCGLSDRSVRAIILDSPLLFESGLDRLCDSVVFVDTDESIRLTRLHETRGWDRDQLRRRERSQKSNEYKRSHSDFEIDNNGPESRLRLQVIEILKQTVND